ncbi:MAG: magnesium/cobalt transporter CorA [Dehalococcoidales bacterium]|nr:magnesium/cobalt transporter CorA [Dehalococcoidales bacterium]
MAEVQKVNEEKLNLDTLDWKGMTWIDIAPPGQSEIDYLAENYHFHPLDLDDTLSRRQRPKIDEYKDYLFIVFHFPIYSKEEKVLISSQISVFIGQDYLITIHKGVLKPLVKLFRECELDEESREEYLGQGPGFLLYRILDRLVDYCQPILNKVSDGIEDVEDNILAERRGQIIREISRLRRDVIAFRRIIWPMRAVVGRLEPRIHRFINIDMSVYFGDMVDHLDRIWDGLDEYKEIIEGLNYTHDSMATNRTNETIRILTIIATVMLPVTVVGSLYGMNIDMPFAESDYAVFIVFGLMLTIILGVLLLLRKLRVI